MSDKNIISEDNESEEKVEDEADFNENGAEEESSLVPEEGSKRASSDFWLLWPPRASMARLAVVMPNSAVMPCVMCQRLVGRHQMSCVSCNLNFNCPVTTVPNLRCQLSDV